MTENIQIDVVLALSHPYTNESLGAQREVSAYMQTEAQRACVAGESVEDIQTDGVTNINHPFTNELPSKQRKVSAIHANRGSACMLRCVPAGLTDDVQTDGVTTISHLLAPFHGARI